MMENLSGAFIYAIIGCVLASWRDLKTGKIDPWITYSLMYVGIILALVFEYFWLSVVWGAGAFLVGWILYKINMWGGGDVKLLTAISILLPLNNFPIYFFIWLMIFGAGYSIVYLTASVLSGKQKLDIRNMPVRFAPVFLITLILLLSYGNVLMRMPF